ncbi:hypothetical protein [Microcoleus sp. B5-D4]|uniref:hypothetical protein n=1 Tax=Microcoleus sp. B5-D4 TaxID=2818681 RepID=UPI002FD2F17D
MPAATTESRANCTAATSSRGWDFPGDDEPHYKDFLYFSLEIRMTCWRCRCADNFSFNEVSRAF